MKRRRKNGYEQLDAERMARRALKAGYSCPEA